MNDEVKETKIISDDINLRVKDQVSFFINVSLECELPLL